MADLVYHKHGAPPYRVIALHGGPGAPGSSRGLCLGLADHYGVIESIQTKMSINHLVEELRETIIEAAESPCNLIGHSWGAFFAVIFAAQYPELVQKVILVGSAMFVGEESEVKEIRMSRLSKDEQDEYRQVNQSWADGDKTAVNRMVELLDKADDYDAMPTEGLQIEADAEQNRLVWSEAKELRSNGDLLRLAASIKCPVVAIHGEHDPHPYKPVFEPLSANIADFESHLLEKCGHTPWREKHARDLFFGILRNQVGV